MTVKIITWILTENENKEEFKIWSQLKVAPFNYQGNTIDFISFEDWLKDYYKKFLHNDIENNKVVIEVDEDKLKMDTRFRKDILDLSGKAKISFWNTAPSELWVKVIKKSKQIKVSKDLNEYRINLQIEKKEDWLAGSGYLTPQSDRLAILLDFDNASDLDKTFDYIRENEEHIISWRGRAKWQGTIGGERKCILKGPIRRVNDTNTNQPDEEKGLEEKLALLVEQAGDLMKIKKELQHELEKLVEKDLDEIIAAVEQALKTKDKKQIDSKFKELQNFIGSQSRQKKQAYEKQKRKVQQLLLEKEQSSLYSTTTTADNKFFGDKKKLIGGITMIVIVGLVGFGFFYWKNNKKKNLHSSQRLAF
ncbi:hypothetical protein [endosymbiont GvMRE of Glomus versiforme]|uniref:hypothetical protein n=1 Tax=endosymbiont GvMRE of Glomus versiforme TaxID=2039283 RepID=UPI000ECE3738|nr:hypothetical protein [endosymbiont GvMRE of Glomus versiforme]RHZ35589.1 hypothetical protein GvMRE_IIg526 [endosymbiont GvMRE of Glomus versiforme]